MAYATAPGSVAADGDGKNGLYTEELLHALQVPGLKVEDVFKRVRINVARRSKGAQTPWESSSLTGDLVVNATANVTTAACRRRRRRSIARPCSGCRSRTAPIPRRFEAYLKQYPDGTFAPLARQRLASARPPARTLDAARFDGTWKVTVECPPHQSAAGYTQRFFAEVKDGVLAGSSGASGSRAR